MQLQGTHAIVTGGSSGIGLATAVRLRARGARVSLVARDPARLDAAAAAVGPGTAVAPADVTDAIALRAAVDGLVAGSGPCDLLVCSAGAAHPGYFEALDDRVFREQMDLDYFGTLHAVRAVLPSMLARGRGTIVGVSSTAGLLGVFGYGAYAPAKYAVRGLMETLAAEYGGRGLVMACAFPPDTETPGYEAENRLKPPETFAVSAGIKPISADRMAAAIVRGIERDRLVITADPQTALLARVGGLLRPAVSRLMDRQVRRAAP